MGWENFLSQPPPQSLETKVEIRKRRVETLNTRIGFQMVYFKQRCRRETRELFQATPIFRIEIFWIWNWKSFGSDFDSNSKICKFWLWFRLQSRLSRYWNWNRMSKILKVEIFAQPYFLSFPIKVVSAFFF